MKRGRRPWPTNERRQKSTGIQAHRLGGAAKAMTAEPYSIAQADELGKLDVSWLGTLPAHATTHQNGGTDEISVTGLSGLLADDQNPTAHATDHQNGGGDEISVAGLSGLLADGQTPIAHNTSHQSAGSDAIKLDDLAAPDDNTDLNASTTAHGLLKKLSNVSTEFLNGQGNFATPASTGDLVFTATPGDTAINSLTDVTIFTRDVTGLAAGDQLIAEGWFHILNNSGAGRTYVINLDFDGTFACRVTTASLAASTDLHWFRFSGILTVISSSEAITMFDVRGRPATAQASGANDSASTAHFDHKTWETTATDRTGTQTVTLNIQSSDATATQTFKLRNATIRKVTPT